MLSEIATEASIILLLVLVNGIFAMSEIAIVTSRKVRLEQRAAGGDAGAAAALALAQEPTQFLSTVQVGITLIGILAGAFGGATLSDEFGAMFTSVPLLAPYARPLSLALVVGSITYLSLIVGELVPKRLALGAPERIAAIVARPMRTLSRIAAPFVRVLTASTNIVLRLLGMRVNPEAGLTEVEIRAMLEEGAESGVVEQTEHEIVESVFRMGDRSVRSIMTPRHALEWIDLADADGAALARQLADERRALYLVCDADLDRVVGFMRAQDLLARCLAGSPLRRDTLEAATQPPVFAPSTMPALQLVNTLRAERQQAAVVLDEYGGVSGVVTLHDVLEALVGDLPSETGESSIARLDDGSWLVDAALSVMDIEAELDIPLREEGRAEYQTLAGFMLTRLDRLPEVGDQVVWHGHRFTVRTMDGRRVDTVLVAPAPG